ncbi:MAG TPA: RnfABCDGE type electron transport complex subunit G [Synergistaceae bacterium]|nr:RnfABCDGE type electron transport complex subunit G [Synergistaceae bacterium]HPJ25621.1 RnfABCDGE type electron transport complex subunit G [Synergistaceae bacterium]HPQ37708.1 RnfABCDGE type electron transport complex subunit G [Synergistaceae bacterium]
MNRSFRLGAVLLAITGLTGLVLGIAYKITEEPIARSQARQKMEAMKRVLPLGDDFRKITASGVPGGEDFSEIVEGYRGDSLVGYALTVRTGGYGGVITLMVGVGADGAVSGVQILGHQETPGLGARATEPAFLDQFRGRGGIPFKVVKPPSREDGIQAITGATITTRGVAEGVEKVLDFVRKNFLRREGESQE